MVAGLIGDFSVLDRVLGVGGMGQINWHVHRLGDNFEWHVHFGNEYRS